MRAFGITRYGAPLAETEVPTPRVGNHDVRVRVEAAGVNHLDALIARGEFRQILPYRLPLTLGHDVAGVVEAVGPAVTRFSVGDEVFSRPSDMRIGAFAEQITIAENDVALRPAGLSAAEAAALPLVALTAWQALVERAGVTAGSRVLIHGGSGGFGSIAIQLARHLGAHVATTASAANADWLRGLGADEVVDHRTQSFDDELSDFDLVVDGVGGDNLRRSLRVLRPGGRLISLAGPPDPTFARVQGVNPILRLAIRALSSRVRRRARNLGIDYSFLWMRADGRQLAEIASLVESGALRPVVDRVLPFDETPLALAALEGGGLRGKVVIRMTD